MTECNMRPGPHLPAPPFHINPVNMRPEIWKTPNCRDAFHSLSSDCVQISFLCTWVRIVACFFSLFHRLMFDVRGSAFFVVVDLIASLAWHWLIHGWCLFSDEIEPCNWFIVAIICQIILMLRALMLYLWRGVTRSGVIIKYYVGFCLPTDQSIRNQPFVLI